MRNNSFFVLLIAVSALFINTPKVPAQSSGDDEKKFEVGAQFSLLHTAVPREARFTGIQCVTTPCPSTVVLNSGQFQPGFGARIGYNLNAGIAVEAELNFFPNADSFIVPDAFKGGHKLEGLFGVKAGKRLDKVGFFAKARPGFLYANKGDLRGRSDAPCILALSIFPPPAGICFERVSKTSFAFDLGGVVEVYPSERTILRFEAGDTLVHLSERNVSVVLRPSATFVAVVSTPAETTHNFQASVGVGFRF